MSTAVATPQETEFDAKAFMESRNKGEDIPKAEPKKADAPPLEEQPKAASSRSQRRALNQAMREAAEERGRRLALEDLMAKGTIAAPKVEPVKEDVEPKRADFAAGEIGTAEYLRAAQKWDKAQESKAEAAKGTETAQTEELKTFLQEMDAKAAEDIKALKDWDKVQKAAAEDEDAPEFIPSEHPTLMALLARSDMRAFVLYHFAKPENYDALESLLELTANPAKQIAAFHRLEGRLEKLYDADRAEEVYDTVQSEGKKAAQAEPEKEKTASTPQKPQGRAEPQQEEKPAKPKPSSEVAARGGSPAPDEPAIGSPAWMLKRNQAQYGY